MQHKVLFSFAYFLFLSLSLSPLLLLCSAFWLARRMYNIYVYVWHTLFADNPSGICHVCSHGRACDEYLAIRLLFAIPPPLFRVPPYISSFMLTDKKPEWNQLVQRCRQFRILLDFVKPRENEITFSLLHTNIFYLFICFPDFLISIGVYECVCVGNTCWKFLKG